MSACLLILLFVQEQLSYESMHSKAPNIYRVLTIDKALGTNNQRVGITQPAIGSNLAGAIPEVEAALRLSFGNQTLLRRGDQTPVFADELREADPNFFEFFDFPLLQGDPSSALSVPFSLILTQSLAESIFGSENPMGQTIQDGAGVDYTVTGVMADLPSNTHLTFDALGTYLTSKAQEQAAQAAGNNGPTFTESWNAVAMPTYARLVAGADTSGLDARITQFIRDNGVPENFESTLQPLTDVHLGSTDIIFDPVQNKGDKNTVVIFAAVAFLILLIAIVNYLNLSTARSADRAREVGLRKVVGSNRAQLIVQFLSESVLTAVFALILSIVITLASIPFLNDLAQSSVSINGSNASLLIGFMTLLVLLVGLVAGVYPAFALSGFKPVSVLKGVFKTSKTGKLVRVGLVVGQFALSISLIGTTGMVQKQLGHIQNMDMGYDRDQVMLFDMVDQTMTEGQNLFREQLNTSSAFSSISTTGGVPGRQIGRRGLQPEGTAPEERWIWSAMQAAAETLPTLGIEIASGRNFDRNLPGDVTDAVLINETAVQQLGWDDPLEKRLFFGQQDSTGRRVIGVIKNYHFAGVHQKIEPLMVLPLGERNGGTLIARVESGRIPDALKAAEAAWLSVYPDYPFTYSFLDDEFQQLYESDQSTGKVINLFASLAIFIACLGLFGLVSFSTTQRTKEIGVRKVLGATAPSVIKLLIFDFIRWILLANLIAWPLAWISSSRWLESFAYHIEVDPLILVFASLITIAIAVSTIVIQSWKTASMNPVQALRYE